MVTRADVIWIVVLALLFLGFSGYVGFDWPTTIVAVLLVSGARLAYAVYCGYTRRAYRR
ncbi:MAG: hypothetical protein KGL54_10675 [Sphingomonadales bacterium]|nr:hypothetical protein [Sphingomonadales bacterium]